MDKHSRFWLHYIFHDERDTGQAFSGKLVGLLRERFGREGFLEVPLLYREGQEPLLSAPLESEASLSPRILLIGIGTGAKVAYGVQRREGFHGSSLIAFCPPPGIPYETTEGPGPYSTAPRTGCTAPPCSRGYTPPRGSASPPRCTACRSLSTAPPWPSTPSPT